MPKPPRGGRWVAAPGQHRCGDLGGIVAAGAKLGVDPEESENAKPVLGNAFCRVADEADAADWTVAFDGDSVRLRDSKGLRYLAYLMMRPGVEVHALELADEREPSTAEARPAASAPIEAMTGM